MSETPPTPGLRSNFLSDFIGQNSVRQNLAVFVLAARTQGRLPGHILLSGPVGVGKATLATAVATDLGRPIRSVSGGQIGRPGDLGAIVTNLPADGTFIIEDLHRLPQSVQEILEGLLPDFVLRLTIGEGPSARDHTVRLKPFVTIATTSNISRVSERLRAVFSIRLRLEPYNPEELQTIVLKKQKDQRLIDVTEDGAMEIAKRSAGLPGNALHLLARLRDYALVLGKPQIDASLVRSTPYHSDWEGANSTSREPIPENVRHSVWRRDGGRCTRCGSQERLEFDHIIPVAEGGSNTERNVQILCEACNRAKGRSI